MRVIYQILYTTKNKIYIGSTKDFKSRTGSHLQQLKSNTHHNIHLQSIYNKHGPEVLQFSVLEEVPDNVDLFEREEYWISTKAPELNLGSVGGGDNISKHPNKEEIIARRSATVRAKAAAMTPEERSEKWGKLGSANPNWKGGISKNYCSCGTEIAVVAKTCIKCRDISGDKNPFYGKTHSEETKKKISDRMKGNIPANAKVVVAEGVEYPSLAAAAREFNITSGAMHYRVNSSSAKWKDFYYKCLTTN